MNEEERVEELVRTLAEEPSLRDLLDEMIVEMKEMRHQLNRIEAQLEPRVQKYFGDVNENVLRE